MRRVFLAAAVALLIGAGAQAQSPTSEAAKSGSVITSPTWLRKPSQADMLAAWPAEAARKGLGGRAVIKCAVNISGTLQGCTVVSEDPPGQGFGQSALMLADAFQMKPMKVDGKPVAGGEVRIPIAFVSHGAVSGGRTLPALSQPVWARAPSFAEMEAAWPADAAGLTEGGAALRCTVSSTGGLRNCQRLNELPRGKGFGSASLRLADRFQLQLSPEQLAEVKGGVINVTFRFLNPASPEGRVRKVTNPRWIVQINPDKVLALYPDQAAEAEVRSGKGVADCLVAPDGRLTDCKVARETPEGLGFGPAAVAVAGVMQMNPWTDDGRPVDGVRIRLPISFEQASEEQAKTGKVKP